MKTVTATVWRRMSGRKMAESLEQDAPLLVTSNGKSLYEVHKPSTSYTQEMPIGRWKNIPGWDIASLLQRGPVLILRGQKPLFEARKVSD